MVGDADNVVDSERPGHLDCMICAPVIDDEILDNLDTWEHPRERRHGDRQAALLVVAGDLDNELHSASRHEVVGWVGTSSITPSRGMRRRTLAAPGTPGQVCARSTPGFSLSG